MEQELIENIKANKPELLDWKNLKVEVLKDPKRLLSQVSERGVIYGGLEKQSAVYRILDHTNSFIIKQYFSSEIFKRELANISSLIRVILSCRKSSIPTRKMEQF